MPIVIDKNPTVGKVYKYTAHPFKVELTLTRGSYKGYYGDAIIKYPSEWDVDINKDNEFYTFKVKCEDGSTQFFEIGLHWLYVEGFHFFGVDNCKIMPI